jgi:MHS family proline/betaine transporter-like MFS transporter
MQESPLFAKIKSEGKLSKNPIKESFTKKENLLLVLLALFGATAGQGVVWYTGQFYALSFIQKTCNIEFVQSYHIIAIALLIGTPLFIYFGWWSDKVGRKYIMMAGLILAVVCYRPIYSKMYSLADLSGKTAIKEKQQTDTFYILDNTDSIQVVSHVHQYTDGYQLLETTKFNAADIELGTAKQIVLNDDAKRMMILLVLIQVVFVTMVYGPIAAFLVELFPTRIRYTSMSLPYHIGNGIFGGLTPFIATSLYELSKSETNPSGDVLAGLWYPMGIAVISFIIGMIFLPKKIKGEVLEE